MIPYGRQDIQRSDVEAVAEVLRSDWITQGPVVPRFEEAVAGFCGVEHAIAVSSGTAALHLTCLGLGVGPGDSIWTVPNTFVASASCGRYCGASVDFVDIDPHTWNLDVAALREKLRRAARESRLPAAVIPVDFGGNSCAMNEIAELAEQYGFYVIEDACHAIGGEYRGARVGSCTHSHAAVFSFHPVKHITTGEGGMVVTNDADLAARIRRLRTHGITREPAEMVDPIDEPWYYELIELGYNYRLTDLQAALGLSQLERLDGYVQRRRELARRYEELLADFPVQLPKQTPGANSGWHLFVILIQEGASADRDEVFRNMRAAGVGVNVHYIPVHLQPYYRRLGFGPGDFPNAERHGRQALTLPLYPGLTESEQSMVVTALKDALKA